MKNLNNKGYMLVEIILASAIAFCVIYFIIDLTVKMKNKNDDMFVKTLVTTDQTIVTKKLMDYAMVEQEEFDCDNLKIDGRNILYKDEVLTIIDDYVDIGSLKCSNEYNKISIAIPLEVMQQADEDFDIVIDYRYGSFDIEPPTCSLKINNGSVVFSSKDDNMGISKYGISTNKEADYNEKDSVSASATTFYGYVMDYAGNKGICSIAVTGTHLGKTGTTKVSYCSYSCYRFGSTYYENSVRNCVNPNSQYCVQVGSWYSDEPKYGQTCNSGYTQNGYFCYKVVL